MTEANGGKINWTRVDGEQMAQKPYAELDGIDLSRIASGQPDQLRTYADTAAESGNTELLAALSTAAFMQFRIPQNTGYLIPQQQFEGYQETFDYIRELSKRSE